jgi:hypothetical protein
MKAIPALDGVGEQHHGRPWWRRNGTSVYYRRDGRNLSWHSEGEFHDRWVSVREGGPTVVGEECEAVMADADAQDPLGFPGLRAGQVWLLIAANVWTTASVTAVGLLRKQWRPGDVAFLLGDVQVDHKTEKGLQEGKIILFDTVKRRQYGEWTCYLIHDPVCPERAPWSAP